MRRAVINGRPDRTENALLYAITVGCIIGPLQ